ncbi:MAG TPA: Stk1 family PASTA domain-containing Ser/Thr kinase [Solirubrobacteraceae bacterium]|jgi:serine/threonine-protein kinase
MTEPGTIIDGRYKVLERIGSGGMAEVYLAEDQLLGRQLAVKVLYRHFAEDQEFVERFRREASSAAGLSHPNIVGIFDRGEWNGTYYISMEYVPGRSLKTIVREQGALAPASAIDIAIQILRAARFAHKRGVIHRDLKPHNVILDEEGRARVTDFGIARAGASDMTMTGSIMGTAQYLSPEQAQGHPVSATSDLYSIGVILYELLTGVIPFEGETAVAIAFKQVSAEPRPPSELNPALPPSLDAIVLRALAKDPAARYASAEEFIAALQHERGALLVYSGTTVTAAPEGGQHGGSVAPPPAGPLLLAPGGRFGEEEDFAPGEEGRGGSAWLWWAIAGVLIAALVALALVLLPSTSTVTVPNVAGQTEQAASARLRRAGLSVAASQVSSTTVASGLVVSQAPSGGSRAKRGASVSIAVSSGPGSATVTNVEGLSAAQAVARLRKAGFAPTTKPEASATVAAGEAIATDPPAGSELKVGGAVTVLVSSGPAPVHVPDLEGQTREAAEAALTNAGLAVGSVASRVSASQAPGTVLSQSPTSGTSLAAGGKVDLVVAKAPQEIAVPGVVGQNEAQAAAALGAAGLVPKTASATTTEPTQVGVVLQQSPAAGARAKKGATVTITVGVLGPQTTPTTPTPTPTTTTTTTTAPPPPAPTG